MKQSLEKVIKRLIKRCGIYFKSIGNKIFVFGRNINYSKINWNCIWKKYFKYIKSYLVEILNNI